MMHTQAVPAPVSAPVRVDVTGEHVLDSALDRIGTVAPEQVRRARRELMQSLAATRSSVLGPAAWCASALTPARFPVEIAFTSASDELRTVVDVIAPEHDRRAALPVAVELAQEHGALGLDASLARRVRRHQRTFEPRFGAWLGSRHGHDRSRHKLYVEVAPESGDAWALIDELAPAVRAHSGGLGHIRFVGIALDGSGRLEVYLRPSVIDEYDVLALLGRCGLDHLAADMIADLGGADEQHPHRRLVTRNVALSLALGGGDIGAVAAFAFAHHRHGRDHAVRAHVLATARADRWPCTEMYAQLSAPCATPVPLRRPWHAALSSVAARGASALERHVGMAPPVDHRTPDTTHDQGAAR